MIRMELETKRLRLRLFTPDDVQITYALGTDPDVIRYVENEPFRDLAEARQCLEEGPLADYEKLGMSRGSPIRIYGVDAYQYQMLL